MSSVSWYKLAARSQVRRKTDDWIAGFSLLEIILVMAVMLTVMMIAMPNFTKTMRGYRVRAEATKVASEIRLARTLAVSRNKSYRIQISPADRTVTTLALNLDTGNYDVQKVVQLGVNAATVSCTPACVTMGFSSSGNVSGEMTATITGPQGDQYQVSVLSPGRVQISP